MTSRLGSDVSRHLERLAPGAVEVDVDLAAVSRWEIGGPADVVVSPRDIAELARVRAWIFAQGLPSVVIGATTNLLFADEGVRAIVVHVGNLVADLRVDGREISAGAGVWVPRLVRASARAGLTGLEHAVGIPGTLGGLVCMNGGSKRREIGEVIVDVQSVDAKGELVERTRDACAFGRRTSVFQGNDEVVSRVRLRLEDASDRGSCRREMLATLRERRRKFPLREPNCGSVFVSASVPSGMGTPGTLIEGAGLKGHVVGGASISTVHANFIVNRRRDARARDVLELIDFARREVARRTGIEMRVEVRYVTSDGRIVEPSRTDGEGASR